MAIDSNDDIKKGSARKTASASGLFDSALAGSVRDSAQQIWLAGMGAFAKAQAEGKSMFEALVREGTSLQQKTQAVAEEQFGDVAGKMTSVAGEVQAKAGAQWGKLETLFEERTAKALQKLGVPSSQDMRAMQDRIDALTAQLSSGRAKPTREKKTSRSTDTFTLASAARKSSGDFTHAKPPGARSKPVTASRMLRKKNSALGPVGEQPSNSSKRSAKKASAKKASTKKTSAGKVSSANPAIKPAAKRTS